MEEHHDLMFGRDENDYSHDLMFGRDENDYSTEWIKSDLVSNRKTFATSRPFFTFCWFLKRFTLRFFLDVSPAVGQHDVWLMSAGEFIEVFWKGKFPFLYIFFIAKYSL